MTTVIVARTDNVWKQYGRHNALKGLNLSVPEGSLYALIGANGAGKTTTIKLLMNILSPSAGAATVLGVDTRSMSPQVLAQVGYVSENQVLPHRLTVGEYVQYLRPFYPTWDRDLEASLRNRLQLPIDRKIGQLSHGVRMKVALACALPFRPKLLILDEPFSGLDPLVREEFMEDLLLQAGEMTILISSHELGEIESVATHVGFLDDGKMLIEESMGDLNARIREIRVTLEHPAAVPERLPDEWLRASAFGNVLTFVDTRYSEQDLERSIRSLIGPVKQIDAKPLPLRSIFTTVARAARDGAIR